MNTRRFHGAAIALVTDLNDPEQQGRIRVRFPWMDDQSASHWCRVVTAQAGDSRGNFIRPEVGDEVLLMFERGDPNQPYVIGSLWNGQDAPPGPGNPDGNNDDKFFQSRSGHQLIFNDGSDGGYIEVHDKDQKLHTKVDVPGKHIHWLADSGTITLRAPSGKVRMECKDFLLDSSENTNQQIAKTHTVQVQGKRDYKAKTLNQVAGSSMSITTPNLAITCKVFGASLGAASATIGSAKATVEPKLELEFSGPVTRTVAGSAKINAKSFRTESSGPSGPLTVTAGMLKVQADGNLLARTGAALTVTTAAFVVDSGTISMGKDSDSGKGIGKASLVNFLGGAVLINPSGITFPATKMLDLMMGLDCHSALPTPPAIPAPFPLMPHGFMNPILLDTKTSVLVNFMPVAGCGATAIGMHMPPTLPLPWTPKPMSFRPILTGAITATFLPGVVAAGSAALGMLQGLIQSRDTTGVPVAGADGGGPKEHWFLRAFPVFQSFGSFTATLASLAPYPVANGSISIGAPNVLAEDTPMSMGVMPFANSCSDIPIVPNAMVMAISNVMVGVDPAAVLSQLLYNAAFGALAIGAGAVVNRGLDRIAARIQPGNTAALNNRAAGPQGGAGDGPGPAAGPTGTDSYQPRPGTSGSRTPGVDNSPARPQADSPALGHPVDPVSGTLFDKLEDLHMPGPLPLRIERNYNSRAAEPRWGGLLGIGWRLNFESYLTLHTDEAPKRGRKQPPKAETHLWALHDAEMRVIRFPYLENLGDHVYLPGERLEFCRADESTWDVTDREGTTWRYTEHQPGEARLTGWFDRHGNTQNVLYEDDAGHIPAALVDSAGRQYDLDYEGDRLSAIRLVATAGSFSEQTLRTYEYDANGRLIATRDAEGGTRRYVYDDRGRIVREVEPGGYTWYFHYDTLSRVTVTYGEDLHAWCAFDYQPAAECTVVEDHTGRKETYVFDGEGRVVALVDREGGSTQTEFDETGNVALVVNPAGGETQRTWDERGRLLEEVDPAGGKQTWTYDPRGWLLAHVDAGGGTTRHQHDAAGNVVATRHPDGSLTRRRFDPRGLLLAEILPDGSEHTYRYNDAGNRVEEVHDGVATTHEFDARGAVIRSETDGAVTRWKRDRLGRPTERQDPDGRTVRWRYTARQKVAEIVDRAGNAWTQVTDGMDRLVERRTPEGRRFTTRRGLNALYSAHLDAAGRGFRYEYDRVDRLVGHQTDDGVTARFVYDAAGHLTRTRLPDGGERVYENDGVGRPLRVKTRDGIRQHWVRDGAGRWVECIEYPIGVAQRAEDGAPQPGERRAVVQRTPDGRVTEALTPLGRVRQRFARGTLLERFEVEGVSFGISRDERGRPRAVVLPEGQAWRMRPGEEHTPGGARLAIDDFGWSLADAQERGVAAYDVELDEHHRRTGERLTLPRGGWRHRHQFDRDGRLRERYDEGGNRLLPGHAYTGGQRLTQTEDGVVEHDLCGRVVERPFAGGRQRLYWDDLGRLREVENPDGCVIRYGYDALDRMVERVEDPVSGPVQRWRFAWVENRLVSEERPDGTQVRYLHLNAEDHVPFGAWVESPWGSGFHRLLTDARGAVLASVNEEGAITWLGEYDPYGECRVRDRGFDNRLRLPGMWADPVTGLDYNRFRWYAPTWGRYVSPDPVGVTGGHNPYVYADGDPIHQIDPLGLAHDQPGSPPNQTGSEPPRQPGTEPPPRRIPNSELQSPPPQRGRPPVGDDGHPVELHHRGQQPDSPLDEMTRTEHRGAGNFGQNHDNTGQQPSNIDRKAWNNERKEYWNNEWDSGRFDDF